MSTNSSPNTKPLIMVVDDETAIRLLMCESLQLAGFEVIEAKNGALALQMFEYSQPSVILMDVDMPELDGFSTCQAIRKHPKGKHVPVIMVTGLDDVNSVNQAYEVGSTDFIVKPINWILLGHRVRYVLRSSYTLSELHRTEIENRALLEAIPDMMLVLTDSGQVVSHKQPIDFKFWVSLNNLVGKSLSQLFPQQDKQVIQHMITAVQQGAGIQLHEIKFDFPSEIRHYEIRISLRHRDEVLAIVRDITEQKQAEYAMQSSLVEKIKAQAENRAKSDFLATMSHQLRTPLNAIIGYSELLEEEMKIEGHCQYQKDINNILSAGNNLLGLINKILDLSKIEAGQMKLTLERFEIATLVEEIRVIVQPLASKNHNKFIIVCADNIGGMFADYIGVRQILYNILSNACKFTKHGTVKIIIETIEHDEGSCIRFLINDSGIGIGPDNVDRIFEPFVQGNAMIGYTHGGTGLGLAICDRLAKLMNGSIVVKSELGKGTSFAVTLPKLVRITALNATSTLGNN